MFTVNTIFFYKNSTVYIGFGDLMGLILSAYVLKMIIAALDTPLCYLGLWVVGKLTEVDPKKVK